MGKLPSPGMLIAPIGGFLSHQTAHELVQPQLEQLVVDSRTTLVLNRREGILDNCRDKESARVCFPQEQQQPLTKPKYVPYSTQRLIYIWCSTFRMLIVPVSVSMTIRSELGVS